MKTTKEEYAKAIEENSLLINSLKNMGKSTIYKEKKARLIDMIIEATNIRAILVGAATKDYSDVNWLMIAIPEVRMVMDKDIKLNTGFSIN